MSGYHLPSLDCPWKQIIDHIYMVEDPLYSTPMELSQYVEIYGPLLDLLDGDGDDSQVSFFFELSRVNTSILVFKNDESKLFFREEAEEMNLIPKLVEVCEGETKQEKMLRTQSEQKIRQANKIPMKKNKSEPSFNPNGEQQPRSQAVIVESARKQLEKLTQELSLMKSQELTQDRSTKIDKIEKKMERICVIINSTNQK